MAKKPPKRPTKTSSKEKHEVGAGLHNPRALTYDEIRSLAGSVESHIQPRRPPTKPRGGGKGKRRS